MQQIKSRSADLNPSPSPQSKHNPSPLSESSVQVQFLSPSPNPFDKTIPKLCDFSSICVGTKLIKKRMIKIKIFKKIYKQSDIF